MDSFSQLCQDYRNQLRPLLEMLKYRKSELKKEDWLILVNKSEQNIINAPEQYLTDFKKGGNVTRLAIKHVFEEFLQELHSR